MPGCRASNVRLTLVRANCGPIILLEIDGETVETVSDFIILGSKITADGDCSYETKRCLLLGRKGAIYLNSILKKQRFLCQQRSVQSKLWFFL